MSWAWIKTSRGETMVELIDGETVQGYMDRHEEKVSRTVIVKKSLAHVSRALPRWTEGADGYTDVGEPIVEGQATIDRIMKKNPDLHYGEDALAHE